MVIWQQILEALTDDFSDLPDARHLTRLIVRLLVAAVLGGALGYERASAGKSAGTRTHMLVAVGAALFVFVPFNAGFADDPMSRVLQGLITGIGFLGGGAILKMSDKGEVHGLTTAAGIWLTAAVGIAAGLGRLLTALIGAALALVILAVLPRLLSGKGHEHG